MSIKATNVIVLQNLFLFINMVCNIGQTVPAAVEAGATVPPPPEPALLVAAGWTPCDVDDDGYIGGRTGMPEDDAILSLERAGVASTEADISTGEGVAATSADDAVKLCAEI